MLYLLAVVIGIVAGLRAMVAPAAIAWAAHCGYLHLQGTWLAFLGYRWTPWILTVAAIGEIVNDKLPATPSRKVPPQFGARVVSGALCGAAIGIAGGWWIVGALLGAVGAVLGTLGGSAARTMMAGTFGKDLPAALIEDIFAVAVAGFVMHSL